MRLELKTQTRTFTMDLPDEHYEMIRDAFQEHLAMNDGENDLYDGILTMLSDHYDYEIAMQCPDTVIRYPDNVIGQDLPF